MRDASDAICLRELRELLHLYYVGCNERGFLGDCVGDPAHGRTILSSGRHEHLDVNVLRDFRKGRESDLT